MKPAATSDIKDELMRLPPKQVLDLCLKLVRFKKENKELISYLLFDAHNEQGYVQQVKQEIDDAMAEVPRYNMYQAKKALRSILKSVGKYTKYTASKQAGVELYLHFCQSLKNSGIAISRSTAVTNLYRQQVKKLHQLIEILHEDLRFDYTRQLQDLEDQ